MVASTALFYSSGIFFFNTLHAVIGHNANQLSQWLEKGKSIYLNAIKQFTHAPETVSFNVLQHFGGQTGNIKIFHFFFCLVKERGEKDTPMKCTE